MQNVLLHCCCAPCSSAIVEWMLAHDTVPTLYFYNPNIYPEKEYMIRKRELMRFAEMQGLRVIDDDAQSGWSWQTCHAGWLRGVQGMENEPERGARCLQCFKYRLLRAAETAVREGLAVFTTTLASSRWKSLLLCLFLCCFSFRVKRMPRCPFPIFFFFPKIFEREFCFFFAACSSGKKKQIIF